MCTQGSMDGMRHNLECCRTHTNTNTNTHKHKHKQTHSLPVGVGISDVTPPIIVVGKIRAEGAEGDMAGVDERRKAFSHTKRHTSHAVTSMLSIHPLLNHSNHFKEQQTQYRHNN